MNNLSLKLTAPLVFLFSACSPSGSDQSPAANLVQSYSAKPSNFRLSLIDAPSRDLTSVFVNINRMELWVEKGSSKGRLLLGRTVGQLDLMLLRNGVSRTIEDFQIGQDVVIKEIRLVLEGHGNYAVKSDGSTCDLKTPSGQQSGIKIKLSSPATIAEGSTYSLVVDFDAEKSVVVNGNGDCLLKPVLKMASFTRLDLQAAPQDGGTPSVPVEDLTGGRPEDDNSLDPGTGFEESDPSSWPPGYEPGAGFQ